VATPTRYWTLSLCGRRVPVRLRSECSPSEPHSPIAPWLTAQWVVVAEMCSLSTPGHTFL
jgi:hypothetical protein